MRKFHISLNVTSLESSVMFYKALLGTAAMKHSRDYAKFELDDPPLVLSLIPCPAGAGGKLNHAGLRVSGSEDLVAIQRRLEEAGFRTKREDNVECCYALQTKFWVADPDQVLWEVYVFHEDISEHGAGSIPQLEQEMKDGRRQQLIWEHRIPDALPEAIPHADNSLDEVHLEGTINLNNGPMALTQFLGDAWRRLYRYCRVRHRLFSTCRPQSSR